MTTTCPIPPPDGYELVPFDCTDEVQDDWKWCHFTDPQWIPTHVKYRPQHDVNSIFRRCAQFARPTPYQKKIQQFMQLSAQYERLAQELARLPPGFEVVPKDCQDPVQSDWLWRDIESNRPPIWHPAGCAPYLLHTVQGIMANTCQFARPIPKEPAMHPAVLAMSNLAVVAATIFAEAGGEPEAGRQAVAIVIYNRMYRRNLSAREVCLQPKQFSCWNGADPVALRKWTAIYDAHVAAESGPAILHCDRLADWLLRHQPASNSRDPLIPTWTHFYNPKLASPSWAEGQPYVEIGNHRFLTLEK